MPSTDPDLATRPEALKRVAQEYADLFNASPLVDIDRLIADACVDPFWDERTNLLSLLADQPEDLGLVLASAPNEFLVVRFVGEWIVDYSDIDWGALEDRAFDPGPGDAGFDGFDA